MINLAEFKDDMNWRCAFSEAVNGHYSGDVYDKSISSPIDDVVEVIAAVEGENDGENWECIVRLKDNRYAFLSAGCDYTGWDCQAGGNVEYFYDVNRACSVMTLDPNQRNRLRSQLEEQERKGRVKLDWREHETIEAMKGME